VPLVLDAFCCAGGASRGFANAGLDVVGVDLDPQPNYPYPFRQDDALNTLAMLRDGQAVRFETPDGRDLFLVLEDFDAVHASPPCQAKSVMSKSWNGKPGDWPELIAPTRELLLELGLPYVIENVVGAREDLVGPVLLCGSMFDLAVERHRLFEASFDIVQPRCNHARQKELWPEGFPALRSDRPGKRARVVGVYGTGGGEAKDVELWRWAMGIDWMKTKHELAECLPPAYCAYIGFFLQAHLLAKGTVSHAA
jgi:DNA (cytosine-5)-methyltransferase 1